MRLAITGSTGMIGMALSAYFKGQGHDIIQISRRSNSQSIHKNNIQWDPAAGIIDGGGLEGLDAVIHLAGANVGESWTAKHKQDILESRIQSTRLLVKTIVGLKQKPKVLISASAIGFYGNHAPDKVLDEQSPMGSGFLPDVCKQWEEETKPALDAGIRVVNMRIGVVLSKKGGALAKMWVPFNLGLGGVLGSGRQMMSWIALDEIPYIVDHLIKSEVVGAVNVVSPNPVSNAEFTQELGKVIKRPTIFPVPAIAVKLLFGEMGERLLLEGNHVLPKVLLSSGYQFHYARIDSALKKAIS